MNLNAVASRSTRFVTPPVTAWLQVSTGWTQNADYSRSPTYAGFPVLLDIQALSSSQIEHMDALNIQGVLRVAYFNGIIEGLNRPAGKGGDTLTFQSGPQNGTTWLCVEDGEPWDTPGWVKVIIQLQSGSTTASGTAAGAGAAAADS